MAMMIAGRSFGTAQTRLLALPAIAIAGCTIWLMLPGPSDAEDRAAAEIADNIQTRLASFFVAGT